MKHRQSKLLAWLLSAAMVLTLLPTAAFAAGAGGTGTHTLVGQGTEQSPYVIRNAVDLAAVSGNLDACYRLEADIDLEAVENWVPIGSFAAADETGEVPDTAYAFSGTFDGNGKSIYNLRSTGTMCVGLFGCVAEGTVRDVNIYSADVTGFTMTAAAIGYAYDSNVDNVNLKGSDADGVKSIQITGTMVGASDMMPAPNMVAGVVGAAMDCTITDCDADNVCVTLESNDAATDIAYNVHDVGVVGGGLEGSDLADCDVTNSSVTADGPYVFGVGGLSGCVMAGDTVTNCTVADTAITVGDHAYLVGGLTGYTGKGAMENGGETALSGCTANVAITVGAQSARVGGLVGGGFYIPAYVSYYPVPTSFSLTDCTTSGAITAGAGSTAVGALAGSIYQSPITNCSSTLTVNGGAAGTPLVGEDLSLDALAGTYQPLFEGATFERRYDHYWHDYCAAILGADLADETAAGMKHSIGGPSSVVGGDGSSGQFHCGFYDKDETGLATIRFDGMTISGYKADGTEIFSHTYAFAGTDGLYGDMGAGNQKLMDGFALYETADADAGEFKYFYIAPDTPESTYHIEFRYGSDLEALKQYGTGDYAYWLGAGILTDATENDYEKVISLFVLENMDYSTARTAQSLSQISPVVGTWDCDVSQYPEFGALGVTSLYCVLGSDGVGRTYANGAVTGTYDLYVYDNDAEGYTGIYVAHNEEETTPSHYTLSSSGSTLTFTTLDGEQITYTKRGSGSSGGSASSDDVSITVSGGSVTASQLESAVKRAEQGSAITIRAAGAAKLTLPASGLSAAAANGNSLSLTLQNGSLAISASALSGLVDGAAGGASVTARITAAAADDAGLPEGTPVFDVALSVDGAAVHSLDGALTITFTVPNLSGIEDPHVLHLLADGTKEYFTPTVSGSRLTITGVRALSYFAVIPGSEVPATVTFTDVVSGAYYEQAVQWAVSKGITSGTSESTFSPDAVCTRAQAVTFLWRAAGSPEPAATATPFTDLDSGAYYYKAVLWAVERGVTTGTGDHTFSPDATVTRAQAVSFQYRAAGSPTVTAANPFADVASGVYYADAVVWAAQADITTGTSATAFTPDAACTRGQIVTFLFRQFDA